MWKKMETRRELNKGKLHFKEQLHEDGGVTVGPDQRFWGEPGGARVGLLVEVSCGLMGRPWWWWWCWMMRGGWVWASK